jgi:cell division septation protein DedD
MIEPALSTATPAPEEDVTTALYRAAIGPVGASYYLPIFTRFEAADHAGLSWNTAASLLTLNWLVFRKLWVAALAYVGILVAIALLVFGVGHLVLQFSDTLMTALGLGFGLVAFVLPGLFGNALFHTECRKAMSKALVGHANVADARDALLHQASTRRRAIWLAAANAVLLLVAIMVYLQVAALSTVAVMPQGALDAGQVTVGRAVDVPTMAISSAPMPVPIASAAAPMPSAPLAATSAPVITAAASPSSTPITAAAVPVVQVKPEKEVEKATNTKMLQAAQTPPKPVEASSKPADTSAKTFFINVGLFGVPENAARAHAKLLEAQLPSVMKELKSKTRQIRVRVGPFATQAAAEAAAEKIKALQLDAVIIQL